jgi:hypothetical protein
MAFYFVGVFLLGAIGGWHIGLLLAGVIGTDLLLVIPIAMAVIGGILACFFQEVIIIISTAFVGAWSVVSGAFYFFGSGIIPVDLFDDPFRIVENLRETRPVTVLTWLVLGLAGVIYQFKCPKRKSVARRRPGKAEKEQPAE